LPPSRRTLASLYLEDKERRQKGKGYGDRIRKSKARKKKRVKNGKRLKKKVSFVTTLKPLPKKKLLRDKHPVGVSLKIVKIRIPKADMFASHIELWFNLSREKKRAPR